MPKKNQRQIIILALMGLAVLYGAYEIFFARAVDKKAQQKKTEASSMSSDMVAMLANNPTDKIDGLIIARAETGWDRDPFLNKDIYRDWAIRQEPKETQPMAKIVYSGYVNSGKKKIAIINGVEYSVGEKLELEGFVLKSIAPSKIKVENVKIGNEYEIPLQE